MAINSAVIDDAMIDAAMVRKKISDLLMTGGLQPDEGAALKGALRACDDLRAHLAMVAYVQPEPKVA